MQGSPRQLAFLQIARGELVEAEVERRVAGDRHREFRIGVCPFDDVDDVARLVDVGDVDRDQRRLTIGGNQRPSSTST